MARPFAVSIILPGADRARHPRVHLHCTPTSASCLSTRVPEQAIESCIAATSADPKPFVWAKTDDGSRTRTTSARRR